MFSRHLENLEIEVRSLAIYCFTILVSVINTPETMYYIELLQPLLRSVNYLISKPGNYGEEALRALCELAETEPLYFKAGILWCFNFGKAICMNNYIVGCKYLCLEFLVILIERHANAVFDKKVILCGTCDLIMHVLKDNIHEVEDVEINYDDLLLQLLRRIVDTIGDSIIDYILRNSEAKIDNNSE